MSEHCIFEKANNELLFSVQRRLRELTEVSNDRSEDPASEPNLRTLRFIYTIKSDVRLHSLNNTTDIGDLWDMIRSDEILFDFVMGLTSELAMKLSLDYIDDSLNGIEQLKQVLAKSYGICRSTMPNRSNAQVSASSMDKDTRERLSEPGFLESAMDHDPWLMTIFMLQTLDIPQTL